MTTSGVSGASWASYDSPALSSFFDASADLLGIADFDGRWRKLSKSWTTILGWTEEELKATVFPELVHPDDVASAIETNRRIRQSELSTARFENRYLCRDGSYQWLSWTRTSDADTGLIYAIAHPVSDEQKRLEAAAAGVSAAEAVASMPGTGLVTTDLHGTVRSFSAGAEQLFGHPAHRVIGQPIGILMPASMRHAHNEAMERYLAKREESDARGRAPFRVDAMAADGTVFPASIALSETSTEPPEIVAVIHDLRGHGQTSALTSSVVNLRPVGLLEQQLRDGLRKEQFTTHYQPIVAEHGEFLGMEALVRWQVPGEPARSAQTFIGEAERTGLITEIGMVSLEAALRDTAALIEADLWPDGAVCSINLSPMQLAQPMVVPEVQRALDRTGVPPSAIALEITELIAIDNDPDSLGRLAELRALGIGVVLDDFGTGYASMQYLHRMPIDGIKIDRSFVGGVYDNPIDAAIVSSQLSVASLLDLTVVGEGVESRQQLNALVRRGCRRFQGYLFARPMPIASLIELLSARVPTPFSL